MLDSIRRFEELSFRTLPAIEQERLDGWVLRWSDGGARRANSVTVIDQSTRDVAAKITECEGWFDARSAPPIFRLTKLADPALDGMLEARGYRRTAPTDVMAAAVADPARFTDVELDTRISDEWMRTIAGNATADSARLQRLRDQLTGSGGHNLFASIRDDRGETLREGTTDGPLDRRP